MKCSLILQVFAAVALVTADDITAPACAEPCLSAAVAKSGCQTTDYVCQCTTGKDAITAAVLPCLTSTKCTNADFAQLQVFSTTFCPKILAGASASPSSQAKSTTSSSSPSATSSKATGSSTSSTTTASPSPAGKPSGADLSYRGPAFEVIAFAVACLALLYR